MNGSFCQSVVGREEGRTFGTCIALLLSIRTQHRNKKLSESERSLLFTPLTKALFEYFNFFGFYHLITLPESHQYSTVSSLTRVTSEKSLNSEPVNTEMASIAYRGVNIAMHCCISEKNRLTV